MEEDTQTTEDVGETEDTDNGFGELDETMQGLIEKTGTKLSDEPEEVVEETTDVTEEVTEEVAEEPEHVFELDDGTKVTAEEAKASFLRHSDYTRKTQEVAEQRKQIQAIYDYYQLRPEKLKELVDEMAGNKPQLQAAAPQVRPKIEVPEAYQNDPLVTQLVDTVNVLTEQVAQNTGSHQQLTQAQQQQAAEAQMKQQLNTRLLDGHSYLEGLTGKKLTPKEYGDRIDAYLKEQGLTPESAVPYIIGPDPNYIRMLVDGTFADDIRDATKDKVDSAEEKRKKRSAKNTTLRVAGKSQAPAPRTLPKGKDGRTDLKAGLSMIAEEQERLAKGR